MSKKPVVGGLILIFLISSFIPMVSSYESEENRTIYVNDGGGTDCISIKQFGNIEHLNDFHRKKIVSKNVTGTVDSDGLHFYGESNAPIYIITLESASDIVIVGGQSTITGRANGTQTTAGSNYEGCYLTDGRTLYGFGGAGGSEGVQIGELRFLHLHLGTLINYTNDFRDYQTYKHNETIFGCTTMYAVTDNITIPSGKWHLIYYGLAFDLDYNDVLYDYKVWLNFSDECENLTISTSEGGKTYGLCYANYDANLVFSRSWTVECMLNGKADFQINDTFLYEFVSHPFTWGASGIWNVKWNTPQGEQSFFAVMLKKKLYCNENNVEGAVYGIGTYGSYSLQTSYFAYDSTDKGLAWTPFFVGLDVKLP